MYKSFVGHVRPSACRYLWVFMSAIWRVGWENAGRRAEQPIKTGEALWDQKTGKKVHLIVYLTIGTVHLNVSRYMFHFSHICFFLVYQRHQKHPKINENTSQSIPPKKPGQIFSGQTRPKQCFFLRFYNGYLKKVPCWVSGSLPRFGLRQKAQSEALGASAARFLLAPSNGEREMQDVCATFFKNPGKA